MFRERIPQGQLTAWLFAGTVPVLVQLLSGSSWVWVAAAGAVSAGLTLWLCRGIGTLPKWYCAVLYVYIVVLISRLLPYAAQSWPTGDATAVPLMLLALAAWSANKGTSAAARAGAVLFWIVLILYLVVFGAGVKDIRWQWLRPQWGKPDPLGLTLFLLPALATCLTRPEQKYTSRSFLSPTFVIAGAMITAGVLSPTVASRLPNAFYEMSRSINLLGIARRFEPLISAGMTVGWFTLLSLLLTVCGALSDEILHGRGKAGVWTAAAIAAIGFLCGLHISGWFLLICGAVFGGGNLILTQGLGKRKKS